MPHVPPSGSATAVFTSLLTAICIILSTWLIITVDLRKCCSEDDLPTAPWRFLLSFIPFLVLLCSFRKVRISRKVMIACNVSCNGFCLLRHTKAWLACDIISGTMFSCVFYYIMNFEIIPLDK